MSKNRPDLQPDLRTCLKAFFRFCNDLLNEDPQIEDKLFSRVSYHDRYNIGTGMQYCRIVIPFAITDEERRLSAKHCSFYLCAFCIPCTRAFWEEHQKGGGFLAASIRILEKIEQSPQSALMKFGYGAALIKAEHSGKYETCAIYTLEPGRIPSKRKLARFCAQLHANFHKYLYWADDGPSNRTELPQIGWHAIKPNLLFIGTELLRGISEESVPYISRIFCEEPPERVEKLSFEGIPPQVSATLIAFLSFSILKLFFTGYPARISPNDPYKKVLRDLDKAIAVSLNGPFAEEYARLICGAFLESEKGFHPRVLGKPETTLVSSVHDGIVIIVNRAKKPRYMEKHEWKKQLLRDACVLFVNCNCEADPRLIQLTLPANTAKPSESVSSSWIFAIRLFIHRIPVLLRRDFEIKKNNALRKRATKHFQIVRPSGAYSFIMSEGIPTAKKRLLDYQFALNQLREKAKADKGTATIYAFLLASLRVFLAETNILSDHLVKQFEELAHIYFAQIGDRGITRYDPFQAFGSYLSHCLSANRILAVRAEQNTAAPPAGWYDGKKNRLYLPYDSYHDDFATYCRERGLPAPPSKNQLRRDYLSPYGIPVSQKNGKEGRYLRYSNMVVVAPASVLHPQKTSVLTIDLTKLEEYFPLEEDAKEACERLAAQKIPRRVDSRKQ